MQTVSVQTSPVKDGRRVLGDKTPNASWTPAKKRIVELEKSKSTVISLKPLQESPKTRDLSPPPCHAGQKRTIDQVENADDPEPRKTLITSLPQRQGRFEIFEDSAQPVAASQPQDPRPDAIEPEAPKMEAPPQQNKESSQERPSKSPERVDAVPTSTVPTDPEARRRFIQEKAALMKRRIQTAMRRVEDNKDNSLDRALSEFEARTRPFSRYSIVSSRTISRPASTVGSVLESAAVTESRKLLAPLPRESTPRSDRNTTRTISSPTSAGDDSQEEDDMPTPRPTQHRNPDTTREPAQVSSPSTAAHVQSNSSSSSSSSSGSSDSDGNRDAAAAANRPTGNERENAVDRMVSLADRVNSEQAVNGLMKLMETSTEYDNLDTWTG
ncbi:hypothetical protein VTN77DRAFT_7519 [Rasamsonia byssochlamydoides]|uniref:uncharacterized protein n=1 Tax=Rasamsonia byssochlamydoides TaxID=89139 RepID=UPI003743EEE3